MEQGRWSGDCAGRCSGSWGRAGFDRTHNYASTVIYDLPIGPGRRWLTDGLAGKVLGGWQISGIFS